MRSYYFLLLCLCCSAIQAAPKVAVSIKPIHSLVSGVMQGVAKPELLMRTTQSLHHYSLKPSDRRMLAQADIIFWVGPELEAFMPRLLVNLDDNTRVVSLIESGNLKKLPLRQVHQHHDNKPSRTDGHIWLDTRNADILVDEISRQLVSIDPANRQQYIINANKLHERIKTLRKKLHVSLSGTSNPFLSYHDAYQYFENEFKLNNNGFVTNSMDLSPGARRIRELKKVIADDSIECLFYDAPIKPLVIESLLADTGATSIALDPAGVHFEGGETLWFQIMQAMGKSFENCLQSN